MAAFSTPPLPAPLPADADVQATNRALIIALGLVVAGAGGIAVVVSLLLSRPLAQLARGMGQLAVLSLRRSSSVLGDSGMSSLAEISQCQSSFDALERYDPSPLWEQRGPGRWGLVC